MRRIRRAMLITGVACLVGACASTDPTAPVRGAERLEPLVQGWERIFTVDWELTERRGRPVMSGYVANDSPYDITAVRLLVEGLDGAGAIAEQRLTSVPGEFVPFGRRYFEAPAPGHHARYRVRVFAYDRIDRFGSAASSGWRTAARFP